MFLDDEDAKDLKVWVMKKLEDISDADSDVLADYVLALIRTDVPQATLQQNTISQLEDFLQDHTSKFVGELLQTVISRSFTSRPPPAADAVPVVHIHQPTTLPQNSDTHTSSFHTSTKLAQPTEHRSEQVSNQRRKRKLQDFNVSQISPSKNSQHGDRHVKRSRTVSHQPVSNASNQQSLGASFFANFRTMSAFLAGLPGPLSLFPGLNAESMTDTTALAATMLAMQAMGQSLLPKLESQKLNVGTKHPCPDYHNKGVCIKGTSCPDDHGENQIIAPSPESHSKGSPANLNNLAISKKLQRRSNQKSQRSRHSKKHCKCSIFGLCYSCFPYILAVEQIPEQNFDEDQLYMYFKQFGPVRDVILETHKRSAKVVFEYYMSAKVALDSSQAMFDNRFSKVYWFKPERVQSPERSLRDRNPHLAPLQSARSLDPEFDQAKFEEKTAEAQRKFEERSRLKEETETMARELEKQRIEVERKRDDARRRLEAKMRDMGIDPQPVMIHVTGAGKKKHHDTEALKAQLAALEDEARELGIDPDAMEEENPRYSFYSAERGRGGYFNGGLHHGRGAYTSFRARGAYSGSGYRGRGSSKVLNTGPFKGAVHGGGKYNLDLRPKGVRVSASEGGWDEQKDEALREHLFTIGEFETIEEPSGDEEGDMVVTFKDRATAEMFFYGSRTVPGIGKLSLAWVPNPKIIMKNASKTGNDVAMGKGGTGGHVSDIYDGSSQKTGGEREDEGYDSAEADERWVVT